MKRHWYCFYDHGVPYSIEYPKIPLKDLLIKNVKDYPDKPFLIFKGLELSYKECNSMARKLADGLSKLGVKNGDRVALMAPNIPQYVISLLACYKIGAIAVPTNPLYTISEITHQIKDSGAETVIVMAAFADKVIKVMRDRKTPLKRTIAIQVSSRPVNTEEAGNILDYDQVMSSGEDKEPNVEVKSGDTAILQYTGGTTGVSKGCNLTNFNLVAMACQCGAWFKTLIPLQEIRTLAAIPIYHIYGFNLNVNLCLYTGGTVVLVDQPTTDNLLEAINRYEPNFFASIPAMIIGLINHPGSPGSKIRSIRSLTCGSAPMPVEAFKKFEEIFGARIMEGYGMSETSNIVSVNPAFTTRKIGSVGIPWPDVDVRIVDLETGIHDMPTGTPGELICRGPQVMTGYWQNPVETKNTLREGWLYTGDIAYMDEDGFIFIVDRKKDMILCSGFNVYPREIEEVLYTNPKVLEACAIGVPDPKRGETAKIFVVIKPGETITEEEITYYCRERLAPYKVPKLMEFLKELPRTSVGKPDRKQLRRMEEARLKQ